MSVAASGYDEEPARAHVGRAATPTSVGGASEHGDMFMLQRAAGNRAVTALVQAKLQVGPVNDPLEREADQVAARVVEGIQRMHQDGAEAPTEQVHRSPGPDLVQRKPLDLEGYKVGKIGKTGEKLKVPIDTSPQERKKLFKEAQDIIKILKKNYGITLNSEKTIKGMRKKYESVDKLVRDSLCAHPWRIEDLRALREALDHYALILGTNRAQSTRAGHKQEVLSIGKIDKSIDRTTITDELGNEVPKYESGDGSLGEYFQENKSFAMFSSCEEKLGEDEHGVVKSEREKEKELVGTFVHEAAHGLLRYALDDFIEKTAYWQDVNIKLPRTQRREMPPTAYGEVNAKEDLCETAMLYFVWPEKLKDPKPRRFAFMEKIGKAWVPSPAEVLQAQPGAPGTVPGLHDGTEGSEDVIDDESFQWIGDVVDRVESGTQGLGSDDGYYLDLDEPLQLGEPPSLDAGSDDDTHTSDDDTHTNKDITPPRPSTPPPDLPPQPPNAWARKDPSQGTRRNPFLTKR